MSHIGLGHDHETRCISIQPVNDSRPSFGAPGQGGPPRYQGVDQGVIPVARSGMHHQPSRLVDNRELLIFEDDGERYGAGLEGARRLMLENANGDLLTTGEESGSAGRLAIYRYQFISY
jgi:hypothetical protein